MMTEAAESGLVETVFVLNQINKPAYQKQVFFF
jgi:hypothetical protein